jgi:tRNA threonylcarbamoyladenosine biosynthesis protein TsaB
LRILAIDTALEACSAAVLDTGRDNDGLTGRSLPMTRGHAEALMPLIATVMSDADVEFAELDRIAVTVGPGSFTGLRVGVAAARAIALAAGKPAVGLTTLAALAAPFFEDAGGAIMSVVDARHDRVYMQLFGPGGRSLVAPRIATIYIATHAALAGTTRIVGNAAGRINEVWPTSEPTRPAVSAMRAPDIAWVARLGAASHDLTSPVRPLYLSEADAHPQEAGILPRR